MPNYYDTNRQNWNEQTRIHVKSRFYDLDGFRADIDDLIDAIKGLPRAEGITEILVPGEPEARVREERVREGIPLPDGTVRNLISAAEQLKIDLPPWLAS